MDRKIKYLEMIEVVIERMGRNSFQLKGWAVSLVALVGALSARESDKRFFFLTLIPLISFWFLDAYYLQTERKYRVLYKNVCAKNDSDIDFNLDTRHIVYTTEESKSIGFLNCLFSKTEWSFYLIIALVVGVLAVVLMCN